jgi:hypothetical protein
MVSGERRPRPLDWKSIGVTAGIPDLVLIAPKGRVHFVEVKSETGRLSPDQRGIRSWLEELGCPVAVVRNIDDVRNAFAAWGIKTREAAR